MRIHESAALAATGLPRQLLGVDDIPEHVLRALTSPRAGPLPATAALRGTLALLFQQASVRTLSSFARAGVHLGLMPVNVATPGDAYRDRCDFVDEVCQLGLINNCVVVRATGTLDRAALARCRAPVINAGDGSNEHPTQALLDVATLRMLRLTGRQVVLAGNLRDHRVQHSLARALHRLAVPMTLVCPPGLAMQAPHLPAGLRCVETGQAGEVDEVLAAADFVYLTPTTYWNVPDAPHAAAFTLDLARARRVLKPAAKVLHPFPRMGELAHDLDGSPYDAYHLQTSLGPAVRFRLLRWLVDGRLPDDDSRDSGY